MNIFNETTAVMIYIFFCFILSKKWLHAEEKTNGDSFLDNMFDKGVLSYSDFTFGYIHTSTHAEKKKKTNAFLKKFSI